MKKEDFLYKYRFLNIYPQKTQIVLQLQYLRWILSDNNSMIDFDDLFTRYAKRVIPLEKVLYYQLDFKKLEVLIMEKGIESSEKHYLRYSIKDLIKTTLNSNLIKWILLFNGFYKFS